MSLRNGGKCGLVVACTISWLMGCGGNAPAPPPVNPYASGGSGAGGDTSSPPSTTPAPATNPAPANPFGGPAPSTAANPFGTPSTNPPTPKPEPEPATTPPQPTTPAVAEMKPKPGVPTPTTPTPTEPAPEKPTTPAQGPPVATPENPESPSWSLALDPAPAGSFAPAGTKLSLKMPTLGTIGPDFVESTRLRVLYPVTPGPFVALGLNDEKKQFREVWNLIEKKKVGQVRNLDFGSSKGQALSPDGLYLAGKPQWDSEISIYSLAQSEPLTPIKIQGSSSRLVAFAGQQRLILEDSKELHVYAVPAFTPTKVIALGSWKIEDGWALSPGGRYFVAITRSEKAAGLTITDLDSGEVAASVPLTGLPECLGVAFSVDGKQLAALLGGETPQLRVWQVETGAAAGEFDLADLAEKIAPRENYQGGQLEWFPDQRHLLIGGKAVYDTSEGQLVAEVAAQPIYPVRVVSPNGVATSTPGTLVTRDLSASIKVAVAPPKIEPGTPEPVATVPDLKPADRSAVKIIELEEVEDWTVMPGKPLAPVKATARGVEIPQGQIYIGCLSQSPNGVGFVMYTSQPLGVDDTGLPTAEPETSFWLETLDLKNGDKQKSIPLPPLSMLMSVSQDGTRVCTQNADGLNRLSFWTVRDGQKEGSLAPYLDAPDSVDQRVRYAEFIDQFTLLTASAGRLTLWDIGTNKAIYEVEIGENRPELSAARDYVAVSDAGRRMIYILESKTGKLAGSIPLSTLADDLVSAWDFHPEGRFLAALTRRADGGELRVIDLSSGEPKKQIPLPISGQVIQWVGLDYILVDGTSLVSVSRACVVWTYSLPVGMHLRNSPDQRHWYIAADADRSNVYVVRGVDMPDSAIIDRIGVSDVRGSTLLAPGKALDLDVEVADPDGETGFAAKLKAVLTDRYVGAKIKIIPGAPIKLTVRDNGNSGWSLALTHEGESIWTHEIDGSDGPAAILSFEPPKHAFPAGANRGAGQSTLNVLGAK